MNKELEDACSEEDNGNPGAFYKLCEEKFTITFKGKTLVLCFGAPEFNSIVECLETILNEI